MIIELMVMIGLALILGFTIYVSYKADFCKCGGKYKDVDFVHWKCDKCGHIIDMGTW